MFIKKFDLRLSKQLSFPIRRGASTLDHSDQNFQNIFIGVGGNIHKLY